jgi:hypothetical protein
LLESGADVHANDNHAIRWAYQNVHLDVVDLLIKSGADVHANYNHVIRWESRYGHLDVVKLFLESGEDVHADDNYSIRWASSNVHLKVVKSLYWRYPVNKRIIIREMLPESKILWKDISNCELLYLLYLPWELIELIKRFC